MSIETVVEAGNLHEPGDVGGSAKSGPEEISQKGIDDREKDGKNQKADG